LEQVTEHLIRLGHRRIAFIGGNKAHSAMAARQAGFTAAMQRHGLSTDTILKIPLTRRAGTDAIGALLARSKAPTAAVCFNDVVALGVMVGLQQRGLLPGRDFAVTGVDDLPEAAVNYPTLTTVATSPRQIGEAAATLLLRRIAEPDGGPERVILPTRLVVRESCGALMPRAVERETVEVG
jgi:LacI family transcriptional regulator